MAPFGKVMHSTVHGCRRPLRTFTTAAVPGPEMVPAWLQTWLWVTPGTLVRLHAMVNALHTITNAAGLLAGQQRCSGMAQARGVGLALPVGHYRGTSKSAWQPPHYPSTHPGTVHTPSTSYFQGHDAIHQPDTSCPQAMPPTLPKPSHQLPSRRPHTFPGCGVGSSVAHVHCCCCFSTHKCGPNYGP
jgi:hypothetical protein